MRRSLPVIGPALLLAAFIAAAAPDVPGFGDRAEAQAALDAARQVRRDAEARFRDDEQQCYRNFFANRCREDARIVRDEVVSKARRQENSAADFIRKDKERDREQAARRKRLEAAERAAEDAKIRDDNRLAYERRQRESSQRDQERLLDDERKLAEGKGEGKGKAAARPRPASASSPKQRALNAAEFERRQVEAAERASGKAREKAEHDERRRRREAEKEAEEQRLAARRAAQEK